MPMITLRRAVVRALVVALALLSAAACDTLLSRTLESNDAVRANLFADMLLVLRVTHFGEVWLWRIPVLGLLWLAWGWSMRHDRGNLSAPVHAVRCCAGGLAGRRRVQRGHPTWQLCRALGRALRDHPRRRLSIVLVMILIGAHNRYIKLPRLLHAAGQPTTAASGPASPPRQSTAVASDIVHLFDE